MTSINPCPVCGAREFWFDFDPREDEEDFIAWPALVSDDTDYLLVDEEPRFSDDDSSYDYCLACDTVFSGTY